MINDANNNIVGPAATPLPSEVAVTAVVATEDSATRLVQAIVHRHMDCQAAATMTTTGALDLVRLRILVVLRWI